MGNRAQKNRLRHGYKTSCSGSGTGLTYRTEKPPFSAKKGSISRKNAYKNVIVTQSPPKRETWKPRHLQARREKKEAA